MTTLTPASLKAPVWQHGTLLPEFGGDEIVVLDRASGVELWDEEGHRYLDGWSQFGACVIGHGREEIADAAALQMRKGAHLAPILNLTNRPAQDLAEFLLAELALPGGSVRFATSGSEAVEASFRVALNYHLNRGEPDRRIILSAAGGYHGNTTATAAATRRPDMAHFIRELTPTYASLPTTPHDDEEASARFVAELREQIATLGAANIAAFIGEPIPVGGGVRVPVADHWSRVQELLRENGILHIVDEVFTGFGRTGKIFGHQHYSITPDIITLSKGLSSGYFPISACVVSAGVADAFDEAGENALRHMGTYSGHATGCAVALAVQQTIARESLPAQAAKRGELIRERLAKICEQNSAIVGEVRGIGMLWSISLIPREGTDVARAAVAECRRRGLLTQGLGGQLFFYPPLVASEQELESMLAIVSDSLAALS